MSFTDTPPSVVMAAEAEPSNRVHCGTNGQGALSANIAPHQTNEKEEWRAVSTFPDYEVSDLGRVRRRVATARRAAGSLVPVHPVRGYLAVSERRNGVVQNAYVHALVCEAFHGPRPTPQHQAAHDNGDRRDNRSVNLRWATPAENCGDKARHGTSYAGERHHKAKLTEAKVREVRDLHASGVGCRELARRLNLSASTISRVLNAKMWSHV